MSTFCEVCGMGDMVRGEDSILYCRNCGAQSTQLTEDALDGEDAHMYTAAFKRDPRVGGDGKQQKPGSSLRTGQGEACDDPSARFTPAEGSGRARSRTDEGLPLPTSQLTQGSQTSGQIPDDLLASMIRSSYVNGIQKILQLQCEALVKQFGVTPLICGIMGPIWLKFVASTRVFENAWAEEAIQVAEHRERIQMRKPRRGLKEEDLSHGDAKMRGKKRQKNTRKRKGATEPWTSFGRKSRFVWLRALKERIPVSITLAISYLCCYIAREPVLPTDMTKWASEGEFPYLAAFVEVSKTLGGKQFFPMDPGLMFRPVSMIASRRLEFLAGFVAERVSVQLPPVNFHAISAMLLRDMGLPVAQLSAYACRLYEWFTPSGLWLSAREAALPTRVYVMSILILSMKILYKLDGRTLQHGGEMDTQKNLRRLLSSKEKGNNGHLQSPHRMQTRAKVKRKAAVEACEVQQQIANPAKIIEGMETGGTSPSKEHLSAPTVQILGKRKRLPTATNGQDGRSRSGGKDSRIFGEASGAGLPDTNARLQEEQLELNDANELIEILESVKTKNMLSYDEKLSRYLKYCRDVIFVGYERDGGMEAVTENFWEIYEQFMAEVSSKPVVDSVQKAAAGTSKRCKLANGSHGAAEDNLNIVTGMQPTFGEDTCRKLRLQPGTGTHGSLESAESFSMDAPLDMSVRTDRSRMPESSKQKQQKRDYEGVLHPSINEDRRVEKLKSTPAREVDRAYKKQQHSSSLATKMKNAGFGCLPPLVNSVGSDVYVRYKFQVSEVGLVPVHGDYFKVLQACGKLVNVDAMALHHCVQILEKGLLQMETNVETFLLSQDGNVATLTDAVRRRKPPRRRDRMVEAQNVKAAAERIAHLVDLSYI